MPVHQECTYTLVQGQPENPITVTTAWKKASVSDVEIPVYKRKKLNQLHFQLLFIQPVDCLQILHNIEK